MTEADDVSGPPENVRSTAIWLDGGEVMWPFEFARLAVDALVGNGHVILGVDARERHDAGRVTGLAISDYGRQGLPGRLRDSVTMALRRFTGDRPLRPVAVLPGP